MHQIHLTLTLLKQKNKKEDLKPPKPPIVRGSMYKKSGPFMISLKQRYFVMNPDEGTFIRYKNREDYPNKPM